MTKWGIAFALLSIGLVYAWNSNSNPVCNALGLQLFPKMVSDGNGGMICCFEDMRPGRDSSAGYEVYAQRVDSSGTRLWGIDSNGIVISYPHRQQKYGHRLNSVICEGNSGEAIVCWVNHHNLKPWTGDTTGIFAQKVKDGQLQWPPGIVVPQQRYPIPITTSSTNQPSICSDNAGSVICAWMEQSGNNYYVKAKRLDVDGTPVWTTTIASGTNRLGNPRLAVVGSYVVVVYDSSQAPDNFDEEGGSSFLMAKKFDKVDGSWEDTETLSSESNTEEYQGKHRWYWDFLDYPLAVYNEGWQSYLYVCEWTAQRIRNQGCDARYHAKHLRIRLHKVFVSSTQFSQVWDNLIEEFSQSNSPPIENFPIRAPMITYRWGWGVAIAYNKAAGDAYDNNKVDSRTWNIVLKYVTPYGAISGITHTLAGNSIHLSDIIPDYFMGGCLLTYSAYIYGNNSTIYTLNVNNSLSVEWQEPNSVHRYNCSPRIVRIDPDHIIVVWTTGPSQSENTWDIYAQRRNIVTGHAE